MAKRRVTQVCSIENCGRQVHGRELCQKHYARLIRGTVVDAPDKLRKQTEAWDINSAEFAFYFWERVLITDDVTKCWVWQCAKNSQKYGTIKIAGMTKRTHRVAWQLANGREPILDVLHSCDNPPCCNPNHLREGTDKENQQDARDRGRWTPNYGERNGNTSLTVDDVKQIKQDYANGIPTATIRDRTGINRFTLWNIRTGRTWKHVNL